MKKLLLFLICATALTACTSDDSSDVSTEGSRLKKVVLDFGDQVETICLQYNGDKQVKQITGSGSTSYFFSGNLITKLGSGNNFQHFEYDSQDRLLATYFSGGGDEYRTDYVYNSDGTVDCEEKTNGEVNEIRRLYFENEEVVRKDITRKNPDTGQWESSSFFFTHDDKNVPDQGVGRWIFNYLKSFGSGTYAVHHNVVTIRQEFNGQEATYGYEYTYNSLGYPITMTQMNNNWEPTGYVTNYFYE